MPKEKRAATNYNQIITIDDFIKRLIKIEKPSYWLHFSNRQAIDTYTRRFVLNKEEVYKRLIALNEDTKKPNNMTRLVDYWKSVHAGKSPSIPKGFEGSFSQYAASGSPPLNVSSSSSSSSAAVTSSSHLPAVEASMGHPVVVVGATTIPGGGTRRKRRQNLTRRKRNRRR
jgi:hypothetical protein